MGVGGRRRRARRARTRRARSRRNRNPPKNREEILRETPGWIQSLKKLNQRAFEQRVERIKQDLARRKIKDQRAAQWAKELSELYDKWRRTDTLDYATATRINQLRAKLGQPPQFFKDTLFYLKREGPIMGKRAQIRQIVEETLINTTTYLALLTPVAAIEAIEKLSQKPPTLPHEQILAAVDIYIYAQDIYWHGKRIREHARMLSDLADEIYKDESIPKRQRAELASMIIDRAKELYELSDEYIETGLDLMGE